MDGIIGTSKPRLSTEELEALTASVRADFREFGVVLPSHTETSSLQLVPQRAPLGERSLKHLIKNLSSFLKHSQDIVAVCAEGVTYEFSSYESSGNSYFLLYLKDKVHDVLSLKYNAVDELLEIEYATPEKHEYTSLKKEELFQKDNPWNKRLLALESKFSINSSVTRVVRPMNESRIPDFRSLSSASDAGSGLSPIRSIRGGGAGASAAVISRPLTVIEEFLTSFDGEKVISFLIQPTITIQSYAVELYRAGILQGLDPSTFSEIQLISKETLEEMIVLNSKGNVIRANQEYRGVTYSAFKQTGMNLTFSLKESCSLTIHIDGLQPKSNLLQLKIESELTFESAAKVISREVRNQKIINDHSNFILILNGKKVAIVDCLGEFVWIKPDLSKDLTLKTLFKTNPPVFHLVKELIFEKKMLSLFLGDFSSFEDSEYKITSSLEGPKKIITLESKHDPSTHFELIFSMGNFVTMKHVKSKVYYELHQMNDPKSPLNKTLTAVAKKLRHHNHELGLLKQYIDHMNKTTSVGKHVVDKKGQSYSILELTDKKIVFQLSTPPLTSYTMSIDNPMSIEEKTLFVNLFY